MSNYINFEKWSDFYPLMIVHCSYCGSNFQSQDTVSFCSEECFNSYKELNKHYKEVEQRKKHIENKEKNNDKD